MIVHDLYLERAKHIFHFIKRIFKNLINACFNDILLGTVKDVSDDEDNREGAQNYQSVHGNLNL